MSLYESWLRPVLFRQDPEQVHELAITSAAWGSRSPWVLNAVRAMAGIPDLPALQQTLWGLPFRHPLGLAAGFDKNAQGIPFWQALGFAFAEVGTVTALAQPGNPKPRLFRLPADQAILNRLGFNNQGAAAMAQALAQHPHSGIPVGINLGKSKVTALDDAAADYVASWQQLYPFGDYFVINVSSPNTEGLRQLQDKERLEAIILALQAHNPQAKPLLVKVAPDLGWAALDDILALGEAHGLAGVIATNTTLSREGLSTPGFAEAAGGISGQPLRERSTAMIRHIHQHSSLPVIGVGGVASAAHAWEKLAAGASLVQIYTGLVYGGPGIIATIVRGLAQRLYQEGLEHLSAVIGSGIPY
ncbi:MAG: quinone-dependent dihydroorotate dehydrogenase [Synechococcales cyanobacterium]